MAEHGLGVAHRTHKGKAVTGAPVIVLEYKRLTLGAVLDEAAVAIQWQTGVVPRNLLPSPRLMSWGWEFFVAVMSYDLRI